MPDREAEVKARPCYGLEHDRMEITEEDYLNAEFEEPWRYELVAGRLSLMSPNSEDHDDASEVWRDAFVAYKLANRHVVERVISECWVRIHGKTYRIGDLGIFLVGERSGTRRPVRAPEIMLEFVSPGLDSHHRDYVGKRRDYFAVGVLEYVIVDPEERTVLVLARAADGYTERTLREGDTYRTPLLPGLEVALAEVFVL